MDQPITEDEQRRLDAFLQLTRLERGLRDFLTAELSQVLGAQWHRGLPNDIKPKVEGGSLELTDFADLKKILGSRWRVLGTAVEQLRKEQALAHLEGLEPVRNDIAHSRDVSVRALILVQAAYFYFEPLLSPTGEGRPMQETTSAQVALFRMLPSLGSKVPLDSADLATLVSDPELLELTQALQGYQRLVTRAGRVSTHKSSEARRRRAYALVVRHLGLEEQSQIQNAQ